MPQTHLDLLCMRVGKLVRKKRDRAKDPAVKALLAMEAAKVRDLDLTVAIVGTVKAGKSTMINALTGVELLPIGDRPTTMLPTRIRHEVGRDEPVLLLADTNLYTDAISLLRRQRKAKATAAERMELDPLLERAGRLRLGPDRCTFTGAGEINRVLRVLNEVTRWCVHFGLASPLDQIRTAEDLPLIRVEFRHLRTRFAGRTRGRFTLIDTPGPDEAGQTVLRGVVQAQLEQASAVIGVLNYTQVGSEADEQLRQELKVAARRKPGRVWVLINKLDQKSAHSEAADEVRSRVANRLLAEQIPLKNIFAVSARRAYLALRALDRPDDLTGPEGEEFAELAFGVAWADQIAATERVEQAAVRIWRDSRFHDPLWHAVGPLFQHRVWFVLQHALDRLRETTAVPATLTAKVKAGLAKAQAVSPVPTLPALRRRALALGTGAVEQRGSHIELVGQASGRWLTLLRQPDRVQIYVAPGKGKRLVRRYVPSAAVERAGDLERLDFAPDDLAELSAEAIDAFLRESLDSRVGSR